MAKLAPGTRAHTSTVHPVGTTRARDVLKGTDRFDAWQTLRMTDVNPGGTVVGVAAGVGAVASVEVKSADVAEEHPAAAAATATTRMNAWSARWRGHGNHRPTVAWVVHLRDSPDECPRVGVHLGQ